jgi:hypothetical protein
VFGSLNIEMIIGFRGHGEKDGLQSMECGYGVFQNILFNETSCSVVLKTSYIIFPSCVRIFNPLCNPQINFLVSVLF